ncbi:OsmC family protein [Pseudomonas mangiferae]|uniref:OsmC family protein n=1 Tax=Pseudomonas mangiferae TaxID=2593654 RepID=A0A553GZX3_9PSED|nr:OsmC family protein [Pseudomonas mangiferae]TRX75051.1 OsmC family protein [Pseudomonas mangiferae]
MKARIQWAGDALFIGESGSGHAVVMDGPPEAGGRNLGIRPMEMVLIGLGGCSSFDVMSILKKARQPVESCEAFLEAERADSEPKVFTRVHLRFVVKGRGLKESQVKRAVELSAEKYCSASIMLGRGGVDISHSYEIVELDAPAFPA